MFRFKIRITGCQSFSSKTSYNLAIICVFFLSFLDCVGALGMESGEIKDSQIKASKWLYGGTHYAPAYARLNVKSSSGSWCSADIHEYKDQYIQIDLLKNTKLTAIATQGRHHSVEYIEKFQIKYQRDNEDFFRNYEEIQGTWKVGWIHTSHQLLTASVSHQRFVTDVRWSVGAIERKFLFRICYL